MVVLTTYADYIGQLMSYAWNTLFSQDIYSNVTFKMVFLFLLLAGILLDMIVFILKVYL